MAEVLGDAIVHLATPTETGPENWTSHENEDRMVLLAVRRLGACQTSVIATTLGWSIRRVRRVVARLCAAGLIASYMASFYQITPAGFDHLVETSDA